MKLHRTETLGTAPSFRARFNGTFEAGRKIRSELNLVGERCSKEGRWKAAQLAWHKMREGRINPIAVEALKRDHAEKFAYFDKHGGRLPMGI